MVVAGGGGVASMLITELSTYVLGSKGMLLSARCKTGVVLGGSICCRIQG
jgi:hypothetical protein